jgi:hypothetical protein
MNDTVVRKNNIFLFLFFVVTACSKTPSLLNDKEYVNWMDSDQNKTCMVKEIGDFEFTILYKPIDYVIALENRGKNYSNDSILKRKKELEGFQYYTFKIKSLKDNEFIRTGILSENEYYERLEYFVSTAQDNMMILEGKDTIPCAMYHFERNYGISPYSKMVLSFEERDSLNMNDKIFIYNDKKLGVGKIAIKINASDIKDLPKWNR